MLMLADIKITHTVPTHTHTQIYVREDYLIIMGEYTTSSKSERDMVRTEIKIVCVVQCIRRIFRLFQVFHILAGFKIDATYSFLIDLHTTLHNDKREKRGIGNVL